MPLSGSLYRVLTVGVAGCLVLACDAKATEDAHGPRGDSSARPADLMLPAAPRKEQLSGALVAKARAVQMSAQGLVDKCALESRSVGEDEIYFDWCPFTAATVATLHEAVTALLSSGLVPETGPASSFAEEARMFDAFIADASKKRPDEDYNYRAMQGHTRGTLWHYQDLAFAWNAMLPQDPIPVDYGHTTFATDGGAPRYWERCGGLACFRRTRPTKHERP